MKEPVKKIKAGKTNSGELTAPALKSGRTPYGKYKESASGNKTNGFIKTCNKVRARFDLLNPRMPLFGSVID